MSKDLRSLTLHFTPEIHARIAEVARTFNPLPTTKKPLAEMWILQALEEAEAGQTETPAPDDEAPAELETAQC